jgi:hypothetical protein
MRPLTEEEVAGLFRKMRAYRLLFWIYAVSAVLYLFAVLGLPPQPQALRLPLADLALAYGVLCTLAVFLGKWLALRPSALRARSLANLSSASSHIFLTLAFLLAAGESMGMVALTAATLGAGPPWKLAMLCLWQLAVAAVLSPDRSHWDRLLTRWESTTDRGGSDEGP